MSSDDKKPKKHFLKAAVAKVFTGSTATSVTDKVVLRFKGHFKKGKTYLQKAAKRDEKAKDERINRAQISDLYKNARILFSLPSCNQLQVIEQIANVIKESKISLLQETIISNIVLCLHEAVQTAVKQNISNSGAKVVLRCLDLLFYGIELKPTHIKLTSAETIGLILVYSADSDLIMSITNKIILKMQTGSAFSRSVDCYIYACIHKYIHEMRPTEKDIAGILELAQDGSCEFAQTFALNALTILTNTIEHGLIANLFLSTSLSVLMRPMVPTKTVLLAIGQLIFASVKRMQVINRSQTTLMDFFVTLKCGVTILIAQKDEDVQIIGLKILVLLESCDPFSIELKDVLRLIMEFFKSEHEGKIVEAALLLNDILTQNPQFSSELTVSPYFIEKGGFERFFLEIMEHGSQKIRSAIENVLLNVMINTDVYTADKWISVVKRFLFGEGYSTPVLQREPMAEYESDVEKLYGTHLNDEKPITVPDWRTRIFALKLLQALLYKTISASVDKRFPINGVDLSEVIRIAFVATTDNNGKLRCHGLDLFKDILSIFGPVLDPDYSDQSILEQYQTQIVTALIHTFDSNLFIEELNGYEAVITLLKTGIARDSSLLRRLCNALTLKLVYFEQEGFIRTKKIFSFLQTWAEIYCIRYVPKDMYKRLPTETQDFFEQVDACHLEILSTLWLEAINHEWRFQSDSDGTPSSTIASNDWSSIFLALSDRLTKASYQNLKYSNHAIFNTLVNTACHILINDCDVLEDKSNKAYLYSLSILISPSEPFDFNQKEFIEPIAKALSSILSINEQKITNLLPALLSILAITEWQIILDLPDFPTRLTDFIRRIMHSRNYQSILDTYNFFSSFPHQTKLNSIIALSLMTDFSKLMSVENYDIVIKKEEVVGIQMTAKFIEYLAEHIDSDKRSAIRSLLFNSLLHLLIVEVSDFWDQYPMERQNLHNFALTNLHSYASLYPSELKTILSSNNVLAIALKEGLRHQTDYITKNTNTYNLTVAKVFAENSAISVADKVLVHFTAHFENGKKFLQKAVELDEKAKDERTNRAQICDLYKNALAEFRKAVEISAQNLSAEQKQAVRDRMIKMDGYVKGAQERLEFLVQQIENDNRILVRGIPPIQAVVNPCPRVIKKRPMTPEKNPKKVVETILEAQVSSLQEKLMKGVDPQHGSRLLADILQDTGVTLADIAGCEQAKTALEEAVLLPSMNPDLFKGLRQPIRGILLFGPPGNGKTMLAKALAGEAKQIFFNISASSLTSKFVGDAEKTVRALFQMARNAQPYEIDSILTERKNSDTDAGRRLKTEFLLQVDGAASCTEDRIFILGATNRPYELDDAVLRRFPKRILLNLPDDAGRFNLIKSILRKYCLAKGLTDSDIRYIASRTSGYSYSDLTNLCKEASMVPLRDIDRKKLANTKADSVRHLKTSDFDKALSAVRPSTNQEQLEALQEFAKRSGQQC